MFTDVHLKRGHSVTKLEFDCYSAPVYKKQVSTRPVLAVDVGFSHDQIFVFYRNDIQTLSCLVLDNKVI